MVLTKWIEIKTAPTKGEIALLEPFIGRTLEHIQVPTSGEKFAFAAAGIKSANVVGFDTESKPTFATGAVSEGPHVVQFALHDKASAALKVFEVLDLFREDFPIESNPT